MLLRNAESSRGVSLHYDITQLPCFAQWKHTGSLKDGYVTGLEPATNFPNPRSFEADRGRVVPLAPGETRQFDLCLHYHADPESVATAQRAIEVLAEGEKPFVHPPPKADWSFEGS